MQTAAKRAVVILAGAVAGALLAWGAGTSAVAAEEAKAPVSATMLLTIMAQPIELRESPLDRAARESGPRPRPAEPSPVTITVKNPCPPGTAHYEPPPLPGRRR